MLALRSLSFALALVLAWSAEAEVPDSAIAIAPSRDCVALGFNPSLRCTTCSKVRHII
jgi:hypothetical protein